MTNDSFGLSFSLIGQVAKIMICLVHQIGFEFRSLKSRSVAFCDEQKCHSRGTPAPVTFLSFSFICKCGPKLLSWHRCGVNTKSFGAPPSLFKVMETEKGRLCTSNASYPDEFFTTNPMKSHNTPIYRNNIRPSI